MSHKANHAYMRMALGLPVAYYANDVLPEAYMDEFPKLDYVWTGQEIVGEICKAWNITRERFIQSMAAPKPSHVAHLIFNDELDKYCGEKLPAWPKGIGLIVPRWEKRQIIEIKFFPLRTLLKGKTKVA